MNVDTSNHNSFNSIYNMYCRNSDAVGNLLFIYVYRYNLENKPRYQIPKYQHEKYYRKIINSYSVDISRMDIRKELF